MLASELRCGLPFSLDSPAEQQDVWFWTVDHVVHPSTALLNTQPTPFRLGQQVRLGV